MIFPFRDDNPTRRPALVTYTLAILNVVALVWVGRLSEVQQHDFLIHYGFVPARVAQLQHGQVLVITDQALERINPWVVVQVPRRFELPLDRVEIVASLFTAMFLHGGWMHLVSNLWFLILFGKNIEDRLGHFVFLIFYLLGGVIATGCHWLTDPNSTVPMIGASGAIAAVLGAYAVTFPAARVRSLLFLGIFVTIVELPALLVLGLWFLLQLSQASADLRVGLSGGVAWWAHVGGFVAGFVLMPLLGWGAEAADSRRGDDFWEEFR